jgi:hypothetical protein
MATLAIELSAKFTRNVQVPVFCQTTWHAAVRPAGHRHQGRRPPLISPLSGDTEAAGDNAAGLSLQKAGEAMPCQVSLVGMAHRV